MRVLARKRPLFEHEVAKGEFDVVSVAGPSRMVVHNCTMHADLRRMHMTHAEFGVCEAFGDGDATDDVCARGIGPLLDYVRRGGCSTCFMYGQTGSGKSFTMRGIEEAASSLLPTDGATNVGVLSFVEIAGSRCFDLLSADKGELRLQQDGKGQVVMAGVVQAPVRSAAHFLQLVAGAKARRAVQSTGANAESSRSHAVCRLTLAASAAASASASAAASATAASSAPPPVQRRSSASLSRAAVLTLVDCAGTERKEDSVHHCAERRKEGAEINASLHALKECLRHWLIAQTRDNVHIPFRESALTRVLAESFTRDDTLISVVGTLSPAAADTEHSLSTLKTICQLAGDEMSIGESAREDVKPLAPAAPPRVAVAKWDAARVHEFVGGAKEGALASLLPLMPKSLEGKQLAKMTAKQMATLWKAPGDVCDLLFKELRDEMKRVDAEKRAHCQLVRDADKKKFG